MRVRKKAVIVEAVQFLGFHGKDSNFNERPDWLQQAIYKDKTIEFFDVPNKLTIHTLEGAIYANVGDYIIQGIQGELYPCKPDVFNKTYDLVEINCCPMCGKEVGD